MEVKIGNKLIGEGHPCFIVAEIGINHNGSLEIAKQLIDVAADAGCDAVKFQKRTVEIVYSEAERNQPRTFDASIIQHALTRSVIEGVYYRVLPETSLQRLQQNPKNTTNGDLKYALEFGLKEFDIIDRYCQAKNIMWFASCWDGLSAHFINGFNVPCQKIASACLTHADLLRRVRHKGRPVILSTGGSTMTQIEKAVEILGEKDLIILHCVANYPCEDHEVNLGVIETLKNKFPNIPIGYSGHEKGTFPSVLAVVLGASVIERHITLGRQMPGTDQSASLEPGELKIMVKRIKAFERAGTTEKLVMFSQVSRSTFDLLKGDGVKRVSDSEILVMKKLRRKQDF